MTHSSDMVSTGICLSEKGWFDNDTREKRYCNRRCNYIFMTLFITFVKGIAVVIVGLKLVNQIYKPTPEIVNI